MKYHQWKQRGKRRRLRWQSLPTDDPAVRKFKEFHKENPHVYELLRELALDLLSRGHRRYGINSLTEVVRWHHALETTDTDFKLNYNYRPFYARLLMENEPRLVSFFRVREAVADQM